MTLQELKQSIENKSLSKQMLVIEGDIKSFLIQQYIDEISKLWELNKSYTESLDIFTPSIFGDCSYDVNKVYIYNPDKFTNDIMIDAPLIVVSKKVTGDKIVFPKLDDWQITGYVYGIGNGISKNILDKIIKLCNNDLYRIKNELDKVNMFPEHDRESILTSAIKEGMFMDTTDMNIFTFSKALIAKDVKTIIAVYKQLYVCDVEPLALVTIMCRDLESAVKVKSVKNPTVMNTGLKSDKQIYAISKAYSSFSLDKLVRCLESFYDMDYKLKSGELPENKIVDYIMGMMLSK